MRSHYSLQLEEPPRHRIVIRQKFSKLKKVIIVSFKIIIVIFALIGMTFTAVFAGMQVGLLNVRGTIAERNQFYGSVPKVTPSTSCVRQGNDGNVTGICGWNTNAEWTVVRDGILKDVGTINDVSTKTGVPARMIASVVVPEQLRFFTSERESFKKYFEPLKVLGSMSQFSLGVAGIKQQTATLIERNTHDNNSDFYPGPGYDTLVTYPVNSNHDSVEYARLTDTKNHYYAYLYAALYINEIEAQWQKQGYDITNRPDILVTLFNIGFTASKPKDSPQIGGSPITLGNKTYSFGELGSLFYHSDELIQTLPRI